MMNRKKWIVVVGLAVFLLTVLFPPYSDRYGFWDFRYWLVWDVVDHGIVYELLYFEWLALGVSFVAAMYLAKPGGAPNGKNRPPEAPP